MVSHTGICAAAGVLAIGVTIVVIVFGVKYSRAKRDVEGTKWAIYILNQHIICVE